MLARPIALSRLYCGVIISDRQTTRAATIQAYRLLLMLNIKLNGDIQD